MSPGLLYPCSPLLLKSNSNPLCWYMYPHLGLSTFLTTYCIPSCPLLCSRPSSSPSLGPRFYDLEEQVTSFPLRRTSPHRVFACLIPYYPPSVSLRPAPYQPVRRRSLIVLSLSNLFISFMALPNLKLLVYWFVY